MDAHAGEAFIWLHNDGSIDAHGSEKHVNHLVRYLINTLMVLNLLLVINC